MSAAHPPMPSDRSSAAKAPVESPSSGRSASRGALASSEALATEPAGSSEATPRRTRFACRKCQATLKGRDPDAICPSCFAPVAWSLLPQPVRPGDRKALRWVRTGVFLLLLATLMWWLSVAYLGLTVIREEDVSFLPRAMLACFAITQLLWTAGVVGVLFCPNQADDTKTGGQATAEVVGGMVALLGAAAAPLVMVGYETMRLGPESEMALLGWGAMLVAFGVPLVSGWSLLGWLRRTLAGWCWMQQAQRLASAGRLMLGTVLVGVGLNVGAIFLGAAFGLEWAWKMTFPANALLVVVFSVVLLLFFAEMAGLWHRMGRAEMQYGQGLY